MFCKSETKWEMLIRYSAIERGEIKNLIKAIQNLILNENKKHERLSILEEKDKHK